MSEIEKAAESLADRVKKLSPDNPLMKHLEASSAEFLRSKGFDTSTKPGCLAAIEWLKSRGVEEAFWERDGKVVWIDFNSKLVDETGWVPASIMADQIHPTDAGYDIWMEALAPVL